jgi:hypothetical protein
MPATSRGATSSAASNGKAARTIVVSTPTTGWFTCTCERGSGIAVYLALARTVASTTADLNFVFVATAGHEVGHGGMTDFMQHRAGAGRHLGHHRT